MKYLKRARLSQRIESSLKFQLQTRAKRDPSPVTADCRLQRAAACALADQL